MEDTPKLELKNICKTFPGVKALNNVSVSIKKGMVHVLCGENGAGKSTLMKIINGIYQPDSGEIFIDNKLSVISTPIIAKQLNIAMIFQELNYIPEMTIEEFLFLGSEPLTKLKTIDWKMIRKEALKLFEQEGLTYNPEMKLKDLSISDIQMLEIIKAVSSKASIIIMDEPTSAITENAVKVLFKKIVDLKNKGVAIIYISHRMDEIFQIGDYITVLRDGEVIVSKPACELEVDSVISYMVGRELTNVYPKEKISIGNALFEVENLEREGVFSNINFNVHESEIIGFAGLVGAGRTEVMRALFGLDKCRNGILKKKGKVILVKNVKDAIKNGIVMLSEDRKRYGLVSVRNIRENVSLPNLKLFSKRQHIDLKLENTTVKKICKKINVKAVSTDVIVENLSGGNQQKVVFSKWMLSNPDILLLDEPTRGIDVGAKYEIYKLIIQFAKEKKCVVMVSSDLPELLGMCNRIYVMSKGKIVGEMSATEFTQEKIMKLAIGG